MQRAPWFQLSSAVIHAGVGFGECDCLEVTRTPSTLVTLLLWSVVGSLARVSRRVHISLGMVLDSVMDKDSWNTLTTCYLR